jgi:hypothetical protein
MTDERHHQITREVADGLARAIEQFIEAKIDVQLARREWQEEEKRSVATGADLAGEP